MRYEYRELQRSSVFMIKQIRLIIPLAVVLFLSVSGREADGAVTIKVAYGTTGWVQPLPLVLGQQEGMFADEGLDVQTVYIRGGPIVLAGIVGGSVDYGLVAGIPAVQAIARGVPVVIVGGYRASMDYVLMGAKGMTRASELKGKTIGVTGAGGLAEFSVVEALKGIGLLRNRDYKIVYAGNSPSRIIALEKGQIQASPFTPSERVSLEHKGFWVILDIAKVLPDFPATVILSSARKLKTKPKEVIGFLRAVRRSMNFVHTHKDQATAIGIKRRLGGNPQLERKALDYYAGNYAIGLKAESVKRLIAAAQVESEADQLGGVDRFYSGEVISGALMDR